MPPPSRALLVAGLLLGTALAALGLLVDPPAPLPSEAVARVNDRLILRDAWLRAVAAVAAERRAALGADDQRRILERLVDEELLVQHGLGLGLVEQDRRLRSTLVSEVMLAASRTAATPDEPTLERFYADNRDYFTPAGRLRVAAWVLDEAGAEQPFQPPIPDALLPPAKLQAYLGPALTAAAQALAPGSRSEPLASGGGRVVLELREREPGTAPAWHDIRDAVRREWQRRAGESAVRALLAQLRQRHDVVLAPDLP